MPESISILVVDDHALFRKGILSLLEEQGDFQVLGEAESGPQAVALTQEFSPDVILMDLHMPGGSGVDAVREIKQQCESRILMLTVSERDEDLIAAISAGADGYLLKNAEPDELHQAIRKTASGLGVLSPEITHKVMQVASQTYDRTPKAKLSPRELEVVRMLADGATTSEVADALVLSESTIKTHIRHLLRKLEAKNRAEAVARAAEQGLLSEDQAEIE